MDSNWEYWKRNAKSYDRENVRDNHGLYDRIETLISRYLTKDMDVLELASGSGNLAKVFYSSVHSWRGIDYSDEMVREAGNLNLPNATFVPGDVQDIGYADDSFDAVVFINALQVIPSPEKALSEARRVLKEDGIFLCSTFIQDGSEEGKKEEYPSYHEWKSDEVLSMLEGLGFETTYTEVICSDSGNVLFTVSR